jgi:hypothetical protein
MEGKAIEKSRDILEFRSQRSVEAADFLNANIFKNTQRSPQLLKLGFTIIAFTRGGTPLPNHDLSTLMHADKRILFASLGIGLRSNFIIVSVHRNFTDLLRFVGQIRQTGADSESFLVSIEDPEIIKHLSFKDLLS